MRGFYCFGVGGFGGRVGGLALRGDWGCGGFRGLVRGFRIPFGSRGMLSRAAGRAQERGSKEMVLVSGKSRGHASCFVRFRRLWMRVAL